MLFSKALPLVLASVAGLTQAASNDEWAARSIYQVITDRYARSANQDAPCNITNYCGGTWAGIVDQLDYIQDMGFTAIQISPINRNLNTTTIYGEAFHGYWVQDLYSLNPNFGTADDLKNLVTELHNRNMYILVDVVSNEMSYDIGDHNMTSATFIDYNDFNPFNKASYYNPYCAITNWNNETMYQDCWLGTQGVATPDLATQNTNVASMLNSWIKEFVSNYSIDGIRIDGAKQTDFAFFDPFISAAGVYAMSEVDEGTASIVCEYQNVTVGLENYPVYYTIIRAFTAGDMAGLVDMVRQVKTACKSPQYLATFIENQDNERFASYTQDLALAQNAMAFTILADGIPKIYYGQEQHLTGNYSPFNRQPLWPTDYDNTTTLYNLTATLNKLRNHAISVNSNYVSNSSILLYSDNSTYATRKGPDGVQIVSVLSNQGSHGGSYELSVPGAADKGMNMTEVFGCTTVVAGNNGSIIVDMGKGAPKVFFPTFNLNGSGLCGESFNSTPTSTSSGSSPTHTKKAAAEHLQIPIWITLGAVGLFSLMML